MKREGRFQQGTAFFYQIVLSPDQKFLILYQLRISLK